MLQKNILKFCFIFIMLTPVFGMAENTPTQGPAVFLPEEVFEFQPVLEGAEIIHEFSILNQGDALLEILKIQSG